MTYQNQTEVDVYKEVSNSLDVLEGGEFWIIKWNFKDDPRETKIEKLSIPLYKRGDGKNSEDVVSSSADESNRVGRNFAEIALQISGKNFKSQIDASKYEPLRHVNIVDVLSILAAAAVSSNQLIIFMCLLYIACLLLEKYISHKSFIYVVLGLLAVLFCEPLAAAAINFALFFFQITNPIKKHRNASSLALLIFLGYTLFQPYNISSLVTGPSMLGLIIAFGIFCIKWVHGSHGDILPLLTPLFIWALSIDASFESGILTVLILLFLGSYEIFWKRKVQKLQY